MKNRIDMINGSLGDKIIRYALPLAVTGILQQLFNAADLAVVGQFSGKEAMAAVGSNAPVIGLLVNLFVGISLGSNVIIARSIGQGDDRKVSKAVHTSVIVALLGGLFLTILGEFVAPGVVKLLDVPKDVYPLAVKYLRIYLAGMPVILLYNFEAAIFRSCGNIRTPLITLTVSGLLNVVFNLFFVLGLGMDVDGVATATVLSNLISSLLLFAALMKTELAVRICPKKLRMHGDVLGQILKIGIPAGIQGMIFSFANIIIQSAVNSLGTTVMAASSAAFNLEIFSYYIMNSFAQEVLSGYLRGYGVSFIPAACAVIGICGVRLTWIFTVFRQIPSFTTIMQIYPISLGITTIILLAVTLILKPSRRYAIQSTA